MEFRPGVVVLNSYRELTRFCEDFSLYGVAELATALEDASGNILIQSGVVLLPRHFARLQELEGRYDERFELKLLPQISRRMREFVIREIDRSRSRFSANFVQHLSELVPARLNDLMQSAIDQQPGLVQLLYYLLAKDPDFFRHLANLGTLAVTIAAIQPGRPAYGRRYVFLAGLCADLALGDSGAWQFPIISGPAKRQASGVAAEFAAHLLHLPDEVVQAIAEHPVALEMNSTPTEAGSASAPASENVAALIGGEYYRPIYRFLQSAEAGEDEDAADATADAFEQIADESPAAAPDADESARAFELAHFVLHVLRMTRFLDDASRRFRDPKEFTEQAVYMIAYNAGKQVFDPDIAGVLVRAFQQFRAKANRIQKIAAIENECLHPPSALAYPRPLDASQIMCKNRVTSCELCVPSWGIHIVAAMNAFGWLGELVQPGEYPKCALGERLKSLP